MDPYITERFVSKDRRSEGRVIKITDYDFDRHSYRYEVVASPLNPKTVGRRGHISATTLDYEYRKVSH